MIPVEELRKFCQISSQISVVRICIISDQRLTFPNSSLARVVFRDPYRFKLHTETFIANEGM